jgi:WD40 repeat protein
MDVEKENRFIVSGHNDGVISCWDPRSGKMTSSMKAHSDGVNQVIIHGDNLISCGGLQIKV